MLTIRLKPLADAVRLRLLAYLLQHAAGEDFTRNLASLAKLFQLTVSHHLIRLENTALLINQRRGSSVYDRVLPEAITAMARVLQVGR